MPHIIWSLTASSDLARLYNFLAETDPNRASRALILIRDSVRTLEKYPEIGRPVIGLELGLRERIVPFGKHGYVVRYRYDGEIVVVMLIRHQRENG
jgi:plasmid stabilization system protein ParE